MDTPQKKGLKIMKDKEKKFLDKEQEEIFKKLSDNIKALEKDKDLAYRERNRLVALLAKIFPSFLTKETDSYLNFYNICWIVYLETPKGQLSWHIPDIDLFLFEGVKKIDSYAWDGHTTEEKYERLLNLEKKDFIL
jgi:hypothetical protein